MLFSPPYSLISNSLLSTALSDYNGFPDTSFFRGTTRLDRERYLRPPQSPVVSLVSTLLFSRTGGVLSHLSILTHRFPQFPPRNLCSLVFATTDTAFFYVLISLGLAESRILPVAPADTRPRTPLISFCTVQLRTLCAARSLATLRSFYDLWSRPWRVARLLRLHGPIPRKGSGNQQQQHD